MKKYLVTGGSGKLGKKVIDVLLNDLNINAKQLITTTRDVKNLEELTKLGVDVRFADFEDVSSLQEAFKGADNLLLVSIDQIGKRIKLHTNAIKAAELAGIKHITYTSMPNPETSPIVFAQEHQTSEKVIKNSSIPNWTVLRNNWYFDNFIEFYGDMFKTKIWLSAVEDGKVAQLSRDDLAYAAASALVNAKDEQLTYNLSGESSLTTDEYAQIIFEVLNNKIEIIKVDNKTYVEKLISFGVPSDIVSMLASFEEHNKQNLSDFTSSDFEKLTGKKPIDFKSWLISKKEIIEAL